MFLNNSHRGKLLGSALFSNTISSSFRINDSDFMRTPHNFFRINSHSLRTKRNSLCLQQNLTKTREGDPLKKKAGCIAGPKEGDFSLLFRR